MTDDDEGPWAVYDCYCLRCSKRYVAVSPVQAEDIELWCCPDCETWTVQWHPYVNDEVNGD